MHSLALCSTRKKNLYIRFEETVRLIYKGNTLHIKLT